jgi:hypothetical protein
VVAGYPENRRRLKDTAWSRPEREFGWDPIARRQATLYRPVAREFNLTGLDRNPETGELVVILNFDPALRKIGADGLSVTEFTNLGYAEAIITEPSRPPGEVVWE